MAESWHSKVKERTYQNITYRIGTSDVCQNPGTPATVKYTESEGTYCDRHRAFPKRMPPTACQYVHTTSSRDDGSKYTCGVAPHAIFNRSGSYGFKHGSLVGTIIRLDTTDHADQAQLQAVSKLTGSFANLGEDLAELDETGRMILKRAKQIVALTQAIRQGRVSQFLEEVKHANGWRYEWNRAEKTHAMKLDRKLAATKQSKRLANGWLELQFGWLPLVDSVHGIIDAYRNSLVRGKQIKSYSRVGPKVDKKAPSDVKSEFAFRSGGTGSYKLYATVGNERLATLNALGLANPMLLGWNLLPFSFVVDWFAPISKLLAYMTGTAGLVGVMGCRVSERSTATQWSGNGKITGFNRVVTRMIELPSSWPPISLGTRSLGVWHAATASSLVRQAFRR